MICKDMKYTALYWALGFKEMELDVYMKEYKDYKILIYAERQEVDFGKSIKSNYNKLLRHKDFVVLECVDRLLNKGYLPSDIKLFDEQDIIVSLQNSKRAAIDCEEWGENYIKGKDKIPYGFDYNILYTSRLVSGLLEYKNLIKTDDIYSHGIFDSDSKFDFVLVKELKPQIEMVDDIKDFDIYEDELIFYKGKEKRVVVPNGIKTIAASAFWDNNYVEEIVLPISLERLGGDCFYYCKNLKKLTIPKSVKVMGNNPFAGCVNLKLENESDNFILENGILYNKDKTRIIYYPINKQDKEFTIPNSVKSIGKHSFFDCNNLEKIIIPSSVEKFENNPFSGSEKLSLENHSDTYVIFNKYITTIIGCLNGSQIDEFVVPLSVTAINRNSFWNCRGIKKFVITENVERIGYNPFAGCLNLMLMGGSKNYKVIDGLVYSQNESVLCCATDKAVGEYVKIKDSVVAINRGVFSGCVSLKKIDFNNVTYIDKSAFTNCTSLASLYIPDSVTYIGEWAFSYCTNLKKVLINKKTYIDKNVFNECPVEFEWR